MEKILVIFFWVSLAILFYCYIGYGILVFLITGIRTFFVSARAAKSVEEKISVTLIVTAYNEASILEEKIENTLAINYPADKLQLFFITDGSIDGSQQIIQQYPSITLLHQPERKGKYAAIKRAMRLVTTPVVIFSDANTMLNEDCINKIVPHYRNEKTGGVAGEKKIAIRKNLSALGEAEGLYWKYESVMKKADAVLHTVIGAAGELFSIRTSLFKALDNGLILDDFVTSMKVCLQGYKIEYEPGAFATELPSASLAEEAKRKIRISAGAYQSIGYLKECLNVFKHPLLSFQYISRRLLRWTFCPFLLVGLFFSNILLVGYGSVPGLYTWAMCVQVVFYFLAFAGWLIARSGKRTGIFTIPFYFVFMNYCLIKGFVKFIQGNQSVLWEKSLRQVAE